jgi:hypothetical protein
MVSCDVTPCSKPTLERDGKDRQWFLVLLNRGRLADASDRIVVIATTQACSIGITLWDFLIFTSDCRRGRIPPETSARFRATSAPLEKYPRDRWGRVESIAS